MKHFLSAILCGLFFCAPFAGAQFKLGSSAFEPPKPKQDENKTDTPATNPTTGPTTQTTDPTTQPFNPTPGPSTVPAFVEGPVNPTIPTTGPTTGPTTRVVLELPKIPLPGATTNPKPAPAVASTKPIKTVEVPEFPPGLFSDGNQYRLADLHGKAIVLFFFDPRDERALATLPQRVATIRKFRERPVAFFAIQAETIYDVNISARSLGLPMPIFADTLGVMMARYRATLSANKSWQVVIIDADGKQAHEEMTEANIEKALTKAAWKFRDRTWPPQLGPAVDAFEIGNYERGMRILSNWYADKKIGESARQLESIIRNLAEEWRAEADQISAANPVGAYDLYLRIANCFPANSELVRSIAEPLKKLAVLREVKAELSARYMYDVLCAAVSRDEMIQKWDAAGYCEEIIRACPGTATGEKLVKYLDDLGKVRERGQSPKDRRGKGRAFAG